jgi:CheY-like chemotaxis protein
MDEETRAHVFDPFFTTKEQGKGTGLGLSIVYGVVEQAGGAIAVSGALAKGTTFEIFLPRLNEGDAEVAEAAPAAPVRREAHVLVVDDEPSVRRVARRLLEREGYRVTEAADGESALHVCSVGTSPPDVILTDCVMSRLSGGELAQRLRYLVPDARIVLMSGYPSDQTPMPDLPEPPAFLQKPFTAAQLAERVAAVLGGGGPAERVAAVLGGDGPAERVAGVPRED